MADNLTIKDGNGASATLKTTDSSGHCPHHRLTDGTNFMPTMDARGRAGYVQLTNGTLEIGIFAEDAAHSSGHTGFMPLGVRNDTHTAAFSGTDGDYTPLGLDSTGKMGIRGTFAEDAAHTSGDLGIQVFSVRADTPAATSGTTGDYQPLITDANGRLYDRAQDDGPAWTSVFGVGGACFSSADQSGSAANVTDAPTSGQKLVITDLVVSAAAAMVVTFTEETSGTIIFKVCLAANSTVVISPRSKIKLATADKKLKAQASASGTLTVLASYYSEA